jgi:hypothetical protein
VRSKIMRRLLNEEYIEAEPDLVRGGATPAEELDIQKYRLTEKGLSLR